MNNTITRTYKKTVFQFIHTNKLTYVTFSLNQDFVTKIQVLTFLVCGYSCIAFLSLKNFMSTKTLTKCKSIVIYVKNIFLIVYFIFFNILFARTTFASVLNKQMSLSLYLPRQYPDATDKISHLFIHSIYSKAS